MFLKRFLMTVLSALGLGALAAGTASAQQIPAPDLFDGQVACSMNVPTPPKSLVGQNRDGDDIGITAKIATGMTINVGTDGDATFGTPQGGDAGLANILYVIDPNLGNCGAGYVMDADGNFLDEAGNTTTDPTAYVPVAIEAGIAADVGAGYTATLEAFQAVVTADSDVKAKQSALNDLLEDDTDDDIQTAAIATARENLTKSQVTQTAAHNALYAATGPDRDGSIYRAGVAEWRAKGAVEAAITAWNTAVTELTTADSALTASTDTFADYVPLGNSTSTAGQILSLIADPTNAMSAVNLANVRTYANAEGGSESTQDPTTGAITGTSNFDAAGNLLIPLEDGDSDTETPLTQVKSARTYSVINTQLTNVNNVVTALEKLQSVNKNALLQGAIDEAVRRAKLEQAHFQAQFDALVADNTDLDTNTGGVQSFKTMYDTVRTAMTKRDNAGVTLETAVQTREAATKAVRAAFTSPQSFYQQLVDRRQYLKDQADAEVTRLAGLTGDDAPTAKQTADAAKSASDTAEALTEAQNVHASFQDLIADGSPVKGLVEELLKPDMGDDAGDDGGLLVSAIDGAYDAVHALTAEDDPATMEDESGRITQLEDKVEMLTGGDDGSSGLGALEDKVNALTAMDDPETMENENGAVTQNAVDIGMLDSDLAKLEGTVDGNSADLDQVWMDLNGTPRGVEAQHEGLAACEATGTINVANCADARSRHNEEDITDIGTDLDDVKDKLGLKKEYIENLGEAIGVDPVTGEGTGDDGMSRVDMNAEANMKLGDRIDGLTAGADTEDTSDDGPITANAMGVAANKQAIMDEAMARDKADMALGGRIDAEEAARMKGDADEMAARMAADDALGGRIDAEEAARMKGDADEMAARMAADKTEMDARMAADEAEMTARMAADKAEMDARMMADDALGGRIDAEAMARSDADMALGMRIDGEAMARADGDVMLATAIEQAVAAGAASDMALSGRISSNADAIASNMNSIGQNRSMINDNRNMIGELSDDLDVVRAGVAASMALAGMPAINGRGIAIGVGSYDGESAFAVGFQIQGEQASFKVGVTSSGGETGASAGVGFNF